MFVDRWNNDDLSRNFGLYWSFKFDSFNWLRKYPLLGRDCLKVTKKGILYSVVAATLRYIVHFWIWLIDQVCQVFILFFYLLMRRSVPHSFFFFFLISFNEQVSPSQFEAHAGFASRRKPWVTSDLLWWHLKISNMFNFVTFLFLWCFASYLNIYISNGVSLHELSVSLSKHKFSASDSDDLCTICADGGDLVLCDVCPRAFHKGEYFWTFYH